MPRTRPPYPLGFRRQMVELTPAGRTARELAREFKPSYETIRSWVKQTDRDEGRDPTGMTTGEREEVRLRERIEAIHERSRGTTKRDPEAEQAPDLVEREFTAPAPDRLWKGTAVDKVLAEADRVAPRGLASTRST